MSEQLAFNFNPAPNPVLVRLPSAAERAAELRAFWNPGMVTSLPLFAAIQGGERRYTQMLPGVVESIEADMACVRIYAAPAYGYTLENYPLHGQLAVDVPLAELGRYGISPHLARIAEEGRLATGDAEVATRIRANFAHEQQISGRAA